MTKNRYTLLAVDDEVDILEMVQALLLRSPFDVITATGGEEALSQVNSQNVDVILLDIMMPDISGITVCGQLRASATLSNVPIVMLTALDDYPTRRRAMQSGADDLLTKPVSKAELVAKLLGVMAERETGSVAQLIG